MGIYRGPGGTGDAVNDASSEALITIQARDAALAAQAAAEAAQTAAELAETNAETAETNAETAETNAETAATNAASSASAASTSASNAASSASAASTSASNASTSASNAASSASAASTSASNAASSASTATTQATNASNSASAASTSATNASNSASAAATSATNAANSATAAQTAQTAAELAETNAETAEANAETAETNAAASASAAATSASNASTSASNAATSATNASNSASAAATSATNASNSASAASTSASNAATSESNAATSASNAAASYDSFDDRYLGAKSSAPTLDNDGNALLTGALYFNTTTNEMKVWSGSAWLNAYASLSGALLATNNLSDLNNTATARTNLGVAIGTDVQAYDADTAKLDVAQSWSAAQSFNAGVTLGDASGDALTINSSAVSIPNGLNFDSNTFVIDATNNKVGIGTASPAYPLDVSGIGQQYLNATTTDNTTASVSGLQAISTSGNNSIAVLSHDTARIVTRYGLTLGGWNEITAFGTSSNGLILGTNTGDPVVFGTSNLERMRITSAGLVGIGLTAPSNILHLYEASAPQIRVQDANGSFYIGRDSSSNALLNMNQSYAMIFNTAATERMRITSTGLVGIGTSSPLYRLQIGDATVSTSNRLVFGKSQAATEANLPAIGQMSAGGVGNDLALAATSTSGVVRFYTGAASSSGEIGSGSNAERMRIDSSGNVLVGNSTDPLGSNRLLVQSASTSNFNRTFGVYNTTATSTTPFANRLVQISSNGNGADATLHFSDQVLYNAYLGMGSGALYFATNGANERMRIDSSGNVGIGTSSPTALLHVNGTARASSISLNGVAISDYTLYQGLVARVGNGNGIGINSANSTDNAYIYFGYGTTSGQQQGAAIGRIGGDVLSFFTASSERLRIGSSGQFGIGGANYGTSGQVLTSQGSGSAPTWTTPSTSSGTVTSVATGNGLSGGTITTSGTLTIACPSWNSVGSYAFAFGVFGTYTAGSNYSAGDGGGQVRACFLDGATGGSPVTNTGNTLSGTWKYMSLSTPADSRPNGLFCRVS